MTAVIYSDKIEWQDHPVEPGVKTKLLTLLPEQKLRFRLDLIPMEGLVEHSHPNGHVLFVMEGRAKIWVEDAGHQELTPGTLVIIPPNLKHKILDVVEPIELLSIATLG